MFPPYEERVAIARDLGIEKCAHCGTICPYCPRLLAVRPDLAYVHPVPLREPEGPGFIRKTMNLGRAIVTHAVAGFPDCGDKEAARRLEICRACEKFDAEQTSCRVCGCNLDIKARWTDQKCPIGKW